MINSNGFYYQNTLDAEIISINPDGFVWPIPGYTRISSYFGKRVSPTTGASSSHSGIDIPAPEGTKFIAVADGEITFTQFLGAGGYTITLSFDNYKVTYCHCSPNYIVKVGDKISKGQVVCIVEAMKLMNEIESEFDGEVVEICVKNEDVVEYGTPLFKIK